MGQTQSNLRTQEQQTFDSMLGGVITFSQGSASQSPLKSLRLKLHTDAPQARKRREQELMQLFLRDILEESKSLLATAWFRLRYDAGDPSRANAVMRAGCDIFERKTFHKCTGKIYSTPNARFSVEMMDYMAQGKGREQPDAECEADEQLMGMHYARILMAKAWRRLYHAGLEWAEEELDGVGEELFGSQAWEVSKEKAFDELWVWARLVCPSFSLPSGIELR